MLCATMHARLARDRARHFQALAIAARQRAGDRLGTVGANPKTRDQLAAEIDRARAR